MSATGLRASLTINDWLDLLGLSGLIDQLRMGQIRIGEAKGLVHSKREIYPNLPLDFIRALDAIEIIIDQVKEAVDSQNESLEQLQEGLDAVGTAFIWDPERLLDETERLWVSDLQDELDSAAEEAEEEAQEAEEAMDELETTIGRLEQAESDIEDEIVELEDKIESEENGDRGDGE